MAEYDRAERRWSDGDLTDDGFRDLLRKDLIPRWRRMREDCRLLIPGEERMGSLLDELRQTKVSLRDPPRARKPSGPSEVADLIRAYTRARLELWTAMAGALGGDKTSVTLLTDKLVVEAIRLDIDDDLNEGNPLRDYLEFSRERLREKKQDRKKEPGVIAKRSL